MEPPVVRLESESDMGKRPAASEKLQVYHFSPPYSLPPWFLTGRVTERGKVIHLIIK